MNLWRVIPCALVFLAASACNKSKECGDYLDEVHECGRSFKSDICAFERGPCYVACYARVGCGEWDRIDREGAPPWLSRCLDACWAPFRCADGSEIDSYWECDGAEDCADGSDESSACKYHVCESGQLVRSNAKCDGYAACGDGSDEAGCM